MITFLKNLLCFLFNKIGKEGGTGSAWKQGIGEVGGWGDGTNSVYTCKEM
jgi:hypothetical protein